jgi:hypothetical protein
MEWERSDKTEKFSFEFIIYKSKRNKISVPHKNI